METEIWTAEWAKSLRDSCHFWIQRVLLPIVVIIGVVGNLVTIVVLTRKRMSCSSNIYLTALAVSDVLLLIFYLILSFENHQTFQHPDFLPYWTWWRFCLWFADASCGISVWLTVSFTLERYIAVCHPLKGRVLCTESRAKKVIAIVFIICPLITCTTPYEWHIELVTDEVRNSTTVARKLTVMGQNETYRTIFYWFWAITFVFFPLLILIIFNSFLINAVHKSKRHRRSLTQSQRHPRQGHQHRETQENKMTMILVAVVILFLICQMPTAVTLIIKIFYSPERDGVGEHLMGALNTIWNFLVVVNAAWNFVLYCVMSDKYRHTLVATFFPSLAPRHFRADTVHSSCRMASLRTPPPTIPYS